MTRRRKTEARKKRKLNELSDELKPNKDRLVTETQGGVSIGISVNGIVTPNREPTR